MKTRSVLLAGILGISLFSCKKEEDVTNLLDSTTDKALNGTIKGKVVGNTYEDSLAFEFSFEHIYEEDWDYSYWEYSNEQGQIEEGPIEEGPIGVEEVAKTSATSDEVDIYVGRYTNDYNYSYIYIENWDYVDGDIEDADMEIYIESYERLGNKTLYYDQYVYEDDIEVNSISFNPENGKFSISLTATIEEGDDEGTTENPGTITMSYSGSLFSGDVIEKRSLR